MSHRSIHRLSHTPPPFQYVSLLCCSDSTLQFFSREYTSISAGQGKGSCLTNGVGEDLRENSFCSSFQIKPQSQCFPSPSIYIHLLWYLIPPIQYLASLQFYSDNELPSPWHSPKQPLRFVLSLLLRHLLFFHCFPTSEIGFPISPCFYEDGIFISLSWGCSFELIFKRRKGRNVFNVAVLKLKVHIVANIKI